MLYTASQTRADAHAHTCDVCTSDSAASRETSYGMSVCWLRLDVAQTRLDEHLCTRVCTAVKDELEHDKQYVDGILVETPYHTPHVLFKKDTPVAVLLQKDTPVGALETPVEGNSEVFARAGSLAGTCVCVLTCVVCVYLCLCVWYMYMCACVLLLVGMCMWVSLASACICVCVCVCVCLRAWDLLLVRVYVCLRVWYVYMCAYVCGICISVLVVFC